SDYLRRPAIVSFDFYTCADGISIRPVSFRHRLVDNHRSRCVRIITAIERAAANDGDIERLEIARADERASDWNRRLVGRQFITLDLQVCRDVLDSPERLIRREGSGADTGHRPEPFDQIRVERMTLFHVVSCG